MEHASEMELEESEMTTKQRDDAMFVYKSLAEICYKNMDRASADEMLMKYKREMPEFRPHPYTSGLLGPRTTSSLLLD
ncbi:hypothetical protein JTE90_026529 [Oedothorax gibbosus]|uniref:Uncharacterized protein n=1 Tax=Oedothorax gibbosus TaxID=931172 RepID=A0AAV6VS23_9ARAC|nr:hypothetical protein JTE90_026529 [Oedothorax gibbosus]